MQIFVHVLSPSPLSPKHMKAIKEPYKGGPFLLIHITGHAQLPKAVGAEAKESLNRVY